MSANRGMTPKSKYRKMQAVLKDRREQKTRLVETARDKHDPDWRLRLMKEYRSLVNLYPYISTWGKAFGSKIVTDFGHKVWDSFWHDGVWGRIENWHPKYSDKERVAILDVVDAVGIDHFFSVFIDLDMELETTAVLLEGGDDRGLGAELEDILEENREKEGASA